MSFTSVRRDVSLVVLARALSWLGDEVAAVVLVLRLQGHGHGPGAVAALLIANAVPIVALSGVVGRLVDRYDNRILLVASSLGQGAVCAVLATVTSTPSVLTLVAVLGVGQAVNGACWQSLLATIVEGDALTRALGLSQAGRTAAGIAAPALAGLLVGLYGARVPLLADAGAYLAVTAVAVSITTRRSGAPAEAGQRRVGGFSIAWHDRVLRPLLLLLGLFVALGSMVNVVEVFLIRETLHASTTWYGLVGAALGVGGLIGALLGGLLTGGPSSLARGFVWSAAALAASLVGIGLAPNVGSVLPLAVLLGLTNGILNVSLASLAMSRASAATRGRVSAVITGVSSGTQILSFAAAGGLAVAFTPREIFIGCGAVGLGVPALLGGPLLRAASEPTSKPEATAARSERAGTV